MIKAESNCRICGQEGTLKIRQKIDHEMYYCGKCSIFYQHKFDPSGLHEFYPKSYYTAPSGTIRLTLSRLRESVRARRIEWRAHKGTAVDIGCGRGELLAALKRRGWKIIGTDWNASNAAEVAQLLKTEVYGGPRAVFEISAESVQLVSLIHVLEHEMEPETLLSGIYRVLEKNGRLVVAVPNGFSLTRWVFGRFWSGYDLPRHLWVFTPKSLRTTLNNSGFEPERMSRGIVDEWFDIFRSARLLFQSVGISHLYPSLLVSIFLLPLIIFCGVFGLGSVTYVHARKR